MAGTHRQGATPLMRRLADDIWNWSFFQAVRVIECDARAYPRVGASTTLGDDPIRFGQHVSMGFAPTDLEALELSDDRAPRLKVRFTGLTGPNGPLPLRITEFAYYQTIGRSDPDAPRRLSDDRINDTLAQFFDIFHHRILSLFYRAWAAAQKTVDFDRPGEDRYSVRIGSTFGIGTPALRKSGDIPNWSRLAFAGHLSCQTRHPGGLEGILANYFDSPARVENCLGNWLTLPRASRCLLGRQGARLGTEAVVGRRVWDRQTKFRIHLGPMGLEAFRSFLPGQEHHRHLQAWVDLFTHREWNWDFRLVLRQDEVPAVRLGRQGQLGWTSWLQSKPFSENAEAVIASNAETRELAAFS